MSWFVIPAGSKKEEVSTPSFSTTKITAMEAPDAAKRSIDTEHLSASYSHKKTICVVGSGLAGSMIALLLAKLGFHVTVYEKRYDEAETTDGEDEKEFGASKSAVKRSINLALSYRGMIALKEVGVLDEVMKHVIPMPCRVIHTNDADGGAKTTKQAYGTKEQAIYSIGRQYINSLLLALMKKPDSNITLQFGHSFVSADKEGNCSFTNDAGDAITNQYDLVIGADGAYSSVRENFLKQGRINFSREYIGHGYKELCIPAIESKAGEPQYALEDPNGLHIWPRGEFMLIALPNPDKSFTVTLFAPYKGPDGFDSIDSTCKSDVDAYFNRHFPDVFPLMQSTIHDDFRDNPVGSLISVRVDPWNQGRTVLIGDAAHAVVPFYGQGMNAAFEDGLILYKIVQSKLLTASGSPLPSQSLDDLRDYVMPSPVSQQTNKSSTLEGTKNVGSSGSSSFGFVPESKQLPSVDLLQCIEEFAESRKPSTDGLSDLCLEHYADMASNTSSSLYLVRKKLEAFIGELLPTFFIPIYTMVAFTNTPYHHAIIKARKQDSIINSIVTGIAISATSLISLGMYCTYKWIRTRSP